LTSARTGATLPPMNCPACGEAAAPGGRFCIACAPSPRPRCPRCGAAQPPDARFCPGCGARIAPRLGEPTPPPSSEPSTPTTGPLENLGLEEAIERIRRLDQRRRVMATIRRRYRRRRVGVVAAALAAVAAGVVAALAMLPGATWLVLSGWQLPRPARVAKPTSALGEASAPATPEPEPRREGDGVTLPESTTTREARDAAATAGEPQRPVPPAPEVERQPQGTPSPREQVGSRPAPVLPRAPELPQRERPQTESAASALPSSARAGSDDREVAVEIAATPLADGLTGYTVRLRERDGRPVTDATVSIRGRRADGALVDAILDRSAEPGAWEAVVRLSGDIAEPRLRVASSGRVQEVPLPDAPR
jgi:Double zinc ribbon